MESGDTHFVGSLHEVVFFTAHEDDRERSAVQKLGVFTDGSNRAGALRLAKIELNGITNRAIADRTREPELRAIEWAANEGVVVECRHGTFYCGIHIISSAVVNGEKNYFIVSYLICFVKLFVYSQLSSL